MTTGTVVFQLQKNQHTCILGDYNCRCISYSSTSIEKKMGKTKKNEENDSESEYLCKYLLIEIFL